MVIGLYVIYLYHLFLYLINMCLIVMNMIWKKLRAKIDGKPTERHGSTLEYYGHKLYMFGGAIKSRVRSNTLWIYYIKRKEWRMIKNDFKLPKVGNHRTVVYGKYMFLFGGLNFDVMVGKWICYNDLYLLNMETLKWTLIDCSNKPIGRRSHGMILVGHHILIHGGADVKDNVYDDCYIINVNDVINKRNPKWIKIEIDLPTLMSHTMISHNNQLNYFHLNYSYQSIYCQINI